MQSLINNSNSSKIPFILILLLIFFYICPNIRFLSVGENSFFPVFIFLLSFSFFQEKELYIYVLHGLMTLIFPIYSSIFETKYDDYAIISSLMSLYLLSVPILSSISLGKIIGARYYYLSIKKSKKEIKGILIFIGLLFLISALLKVYFPSLINYFLFAGRSSYGRISFFFTEPSSASAVLMLLMFVNLLILTKNRLSYLLNPDTKKIGIIMIIFISLVFYFSKPLTLLLQLFIIFFIYGTIIFVHFIKRILVQNKINFALFGLKNPLYDFVKITLITNLLVFFSYFLLNDIFKRIFQVFNFSSFEQFFVNFTRAAGFRFIYSLASLIYGINNPVSIPGDWPQEFRKSLFDSIDFLNDKFALTVPDPYGLLQLYKTNPLLIKPAGWLYFNIFDLGILLFIFFSYFILGNYLKIFAKGIMKLNNITILLFSMQISLILFPSLPSTPSIFFPILIISTIDQFEKNKLKFLENHEK